MTHTEIARLLDKVGTLEVPAGQGATPPNWLTIKVRIVDGRTAYGRQDVLVTPVDGSGEAWVSADRVKIGGKA